MKFHHRVGIGLVAGTVVGALFGGTAAVFEPLGTLFVKAIRMVVVPLVATSLVMVIAGLPGRAALGRMGLRAFGFLLGSLVAALLIGIFFGISLAPGRALSDEARASLLASQGMPEIDANGPRPSLMDLVLGIIPDNPVRAMVEGNILQVLVVSILLGLAASALPEPRRNPLVEVARSLAEALYKLTAWILELAPFGVFGLMATVVGRTGLGVLVTLATYVGVVLIALAAQVILVYGGVLGLVARGKIGRLLAAARPPALITFVTCSTAAALPVSLRSMQDDAGVSARVASFVLPLGAAIGRDGSAIYQAISVIFIAQVYGVSLASPDLVTLVVTAMLSALAVASVPAASFVNLTILLAALGLPLEGGALVLGVERPLDMVRSTTNLLGQLVNAAFVDSAESSEV
ncbi:MAG TPA: dicarboxylate/amino acid:cation symporter [Vicinamibacteria bacterium]|nr:dicarboxylate/amino acid:cation symporter [Vicinamibacteria bacterium]